MSLDLIQISRTIAHALRHEPESYGLKLDKEGWVNLSDLISSLKYKGWGNIEQEDITFMIEKSEKKRYQILDNRIRAYYGHSTQEKIFKQKQIPPNILFHGTSSNRVKSILENGLLPMNRQYVHLSEDNKTAEIVASRKKGEIQVVLIQAFEACYSGVSFYKEENGVWLAEPISSKFIQS